MRFTADCALPSAPLLAASRGGTFNWAPRCVPAWPDVFLCTSLAGVFLQRTSWSIHPSTASFLSRPCSPSHARPGLQPLQPYDSNLLQDKYLQGLRHGLRVTRLGRMQLS